MSNTVLIADLFKIDTIDLEDTPKLAHLYNTDGKHILESFLDKDMNALKHVYAYYDITKVYPSIIADFIAFNKTSYLSYGKEYLAVSWYDLLLMISDNNQKMLELSLIDNIENLSDFIHSLILKSSVSDIFGNRFKEHVLECINSEFESSIYKSINVVSGEDIKRLAPEISIKTFAVTLLNDYDGDFETKADMYIQHNPNRYIMSLPLYKWDINKYKVDLQICTIEMTKNAFCHYAISFIPDLHFKQFVETFYKMFNGIYAEELQHYHSRVN